MKTNPKITVLMPVYNCELYVREAIDSILNQTFADFEFIIIDDCSTDTTVEIIKSYKDSRINLIIKPKNTGYTNSLNFGLTIAKGKYIARMDGDDISLPTRFEKQFFFLENNKDVILCGTFYSIINTDKITKVPENHNIIKIALLTKNCFGHPTTMIRKNILDQLDYVYDTAKEPAEDYDLWVRLLGLGKLHNLQEVLLEYRVHENQVSNARVEKQKTVANETKLALIAKLKICLSNKEESIYLSFINSSNKIVFCDFASFSKLQEKLLVANSISFFDSKKFALFLENCKNKAVTKYFLSNQENSPKKYFRYLKLKSSLSEKIGILDESKLLIKSLIFYKKYEN